MTDMSRELEQQEPSFHSSPYAEGKVAGMRDERARIVAFLRLHADGDP